MRRITKENINTPEFFDNHFSGELQYADIDRLEKLVKHFAYDLRAAKILAVGDLASRALARARDGDATLTMFILKTRGGSPWSEKAGQMKELGEAIVNAEPDTAKRKELVKTILDALGTAAKRPKAEATTNESGK